MTANNIQSSRNPITGTTIAEAATVKRHLETAQGRKAAREFQEYWASLEPATESTDVATARELLEIRHRLEAFKRYQ